MKKSMNFPGTIFILSLCLLFLQFSCSDTTGDISILDRPDTSTVNSHYPSNLAPLMPSSFIKLPVGAIEPEGWLKEYLIRQMNGLTGHLGEISVWLQKDANAWLSEDGKGEWGWEEVPYWLKGYANIGYILNNSEMINEAKIWIEGALSSQRPDGNFGPVRLNNNGQQDFWGNMIMLYCLQSYYEFSNDKRVIELMTNYFKYQMSIPEEDFLSPFYWARIRGGDNLHSVLWLYNRTGDEFLIELAKKIHRNTADWIGRDHNNQLSQGGQRRLTREGKEYPTWFSTQVDWHNVNHSQCFREPAQYYLLSKDKSHLEAAYENFSIIREHFGQVPGGMFGADENARPGYDDPRQGIETCGIVEQMNSDEHMLRITGDPFWADHTENVAFNMYPAATMPDFGSLHYFTSPNLVRCDRDNHNPGIQNEGPMFIMNPFSYRCCQHNHAQGWPYMAENLWMATPDNGVLAAIYSASRVNVMVGKGTEVTINETTNYPYEENIRFSVETPKTVKFPLYLRIPAWCSQATVTVNGKEVVSSVLAGKYIRIERKWNSGDEVTLNLPMQLSVTRWEKNHNSASVNYGPLTFSLKIKENYIRTNGLELSNRWGLPESLDPEKWPAYEIMPGSEWNYGLIYNPEDITASFAIERRPWPENNFPFTHEGNPISLKAKGSIIPEWDLDEHMLCGELMDSPVSPGTPVEEIELIPMGAARLRISAFPVIKPKL